jgi:histidinol-phosphate aminotransferase
MIKKLIRKETIELSSVKWGEYDNNKVRLYWGENLIDVPQNIINKIKKKLTEINRYPDPDQKELKNKLSKYCNVNLNNIIIGNGSDALLELIAKTFISNRDQILIPLPSFITYSNVSKLMGGIPKYIKLEGNNSLDINELINNINSRTKIIFIANPNNPTGNYLINNNEIEKILKVFKGILVIDECYFEIGGKTCSELIKKYENLIILRSFSKVFAIAGLRIGYALSSTEIIKYLKCVQNIPQPFEVNSLAQVAAIECINSKDKLLKKFNKNKNKFIKKLSKIKNISVFDTKTTFILLKLKKDAKTVKIALEKKNILTKDCSVFENFDKNFLYMGIPSNKDIDYVIKNLNEVMKND